MRMTLRQLAVFVAVAKEGTVTRACEKVTLTQSAASMALLDLETALRAPLFDRIGKRLQLNELGKYLLPQALDILERCDAFENAASGDFHTIDIKVGSTLTISDYMMPNIIANFIKENPQAHLQLQVGNTRQIIDAVSHFQLDIGFIEGSCHLPHIEKLPWQEDELAVCCAPNHPLAKRKQKLTVNDFKDAEWIVREEGSGTREVFDTVVLQDIPNAKIALVLGHTEAILKVVATGTGISCLSKLAIEHMLDSKQLVILKTPFWPLRRPFYIVLHRQKFKSAGLNQFLAFCKEKLRLGETSL